jgi:hypothetical protein
MGCPKELLRNEDLCPGVCGSGFGRGPGVCTLLRMTREIPAQRRSWSPKLHRHDRNAGAPGQREFDRPLVLIHAAPLPARPRRTIKLAAFEGHASFPPRAQHRNSRAPVRRPLAVCHCVAFFFCPFRSIHYSLRRRSRAGLSVRQSLPVSVLFRCLTFFRRFIVQT